MAIINGFDSDLLNKVANGYDMMDERLGLKEKEDVSDAILKEARIALQDLMPNGLVFNLNKSVEPRHSGHWQTMRDLIDAVNDIKQLAPGLVDAIAAAYDVSEKSLGLKAKENISEGVLEGANAALRNLMQNDLVFNPDKTVEPTRRHQTMRNLIVAINAIKEQNAVHNVNTQKEMAEEKTNTAADNNKPGPMELMGTLIGPLFHKYHFQLKDGQIVSENAPQEAMVSVYNRLRSFNLKMTADVNEKGFITALRPLRDGESPLEINNLEDVKTNAHPAEEVNVQTNGTATNATEASVQGKETGKDAVKETNGSKMSVQNLANLFEQTVTETIERIKGPIEQMENLLGKENMQHFRFENGYFVADDQDVMINAYNRLRSANLPITADTDKNGAVIGMRALREGEQPAVIERKVAKGEVQATVDPSINNEYKNFMNEGKTGGKDNSDKPDTQNQGNKTPVNETSGKYELSLAGADNTKPENANVIKEDSDKSISERMDRLATTEGLQRLTDTAKELNKLFNIEGNALIAKEGITPEDIDFANTSLDYFYPTSMIMDDAGKFVGFAPTAGYEPLAGIVYSTMRQVAKAQDFAEKMAEKKAVQDALIQVEPINYADYVNDYIYTDPSNSSDENEVLYNAIKFAALQAVKPAAERKKYSEIVKERGDESVYTTRDVIEREINSLSVNQRTAYADALNDVREAVLDTLPPKTLVEFQDNLNKQSADENLSVEEREELTSKLNSVQARMDEMINDVADGKVVFNDLQLAEHYEGLVSVIQARAADNPKAENASNVLETAIADYDERYNLDGLTEADAEFLMDRSIQADKALAEMGFAQVLGRKLKNAVSSEKLSTERKFTISDDNDKLLRGIVYTDENGNIVPQMDENGNVLEDSLIFQIEDMAIAYAYNQAVLGKEKITRESIQADVNDFIYSTAVNMITADMEANKTPMNGEEAEKRVQSISPENPYKVPLSAGMDQIVTQTQQMVGMIDRVGNKIGRSAPVLNSMHDRLSFLDANANSRFKTEYVKSNRLVNTVKKLGTMAAISAAYGLAFSTGGAVLGAGLIAGMTTMRTLAGFAQHKKQTRREGGKAKNFMQYLWSEKAHIAASTASIVAAAGGLAWLSYSVAGLNLANNFRLNLNRDKKAGQSRTIKDGIMGGVETALPMGVSLAMNIAMGGIFADRGDSNASFAENISNTFSDAFSGLKDVFGLGDAAAGMTPDAPVADNANVDAVENNNTNEDLPPVNAKTVTPPTATETVTNTVANTADTVNNTAHDNTVGIEVPHPDLENQTPPPDATFVQSPADFAAEAAAREAAQTVANSTDAPTTLQDNVAATSGTATSQNEATGSATVQNETTGTVADTSAATPADTAGSTDGTSGAASGTTDTTPPTGTENIPEVKAFNHTYDQTAHQHADARIHGQGLNYKLDYDEAQLNTALDQIRTIGADYPQMNGAAGQSNAEILMYKLNQIDRLVSPHTDIVTPDGRIEAQALYGHKMSDGSWYGPHDLRADLLAGKEVNPQVAAEIFAKIEPHIDATGHHIGDIHNFKEAGTWSYRQTSFGGFTQDAVKPVEFDFNGVYGHLDESSIPPAADENSQTVPTASKENDIQNPPAEAVNVNEGQNTPVEPVVGVEQTEPQTPAEAVNVNEGQNTPVEPVVGVEQTGPQTPAENIQNADTSKGAPFVPYIPYDKPYMSKIRRTLNERIGAWMGPIKRALGIKENTKPEQGEKGTSAQIPQTDHNHLLADTVHNGGNVGVQNNAQTTNVASETNTVTGMADKTPETAGIATGKIPQGPGPKRLVVPESDLPKDPYFNLSPISENVERDVNGAWVADFREGAPKINRTVETANADYVTGKLPNTPSKGEIEPTVIPMDAAQKVADAKRLDNREELPEPRQGLPEPQAIRLGTEQVSDKVIPMHTQEQRDAFKRQMFDGNVPKHIRAVLEQRAQDAQKSQMLLENKEEQAKLTPKQAEALLNKYRDVTAAVDNMKQTPVTQNTNAGNTDLKVQSRQKQPQTQTGNDGTANNVNAPLWIRFMTKKNKQP